MVSDLTAIQCALVVDDNRVNRRVAVAMLKRLGYASIVEAENGLQALERMKSDDFSLILMDCEMPVMDGFESTREIRKWESETGRPACLIVALTARVMAGDRERCLDAGMNEYITKPLGYEVLEGIIKNMTVSGQPSEPASPVAVSTVDLDVPIIDDDRYAKMSSLLREGVQEFYRDYLKATWEKLDDIQRRVEMPLVTSCRLIHSIRGSAGNVGASQFYQLAEQLEQRLEAGETRVLNQEIGSLREALERLETEIVSRLDEA